MFSSPKIVHRPAHTWRLTNCVCECLYYSSRSDKHLFIYGIQDGFGKYAYLLSFRNFSGKIDSFSGLCGKKEIEEAVYLILA